MPYGFCGDSSGGNSRSVACATAGDRWFHRLMGSGGEDDGAWHTSIATCVYTYVPAALLDRSGCGAHTGRRRDGQVGGRVPCRREIVCHTTSSSSATPPIPGPPSSPIP